MNVKTFAAVAGLLGLWWWLRYYNAGKVRVLGVVGSSGAVPGVDNPSELSSKSVVSYRLGPAVDSAGTYRLGPAVDSAGNSVYYL